MKIRRIEGWSAFETFIGQLNDFPYREMAREKDASSIGRAIHWRDLYNRHCDVVFLIELSGNGLEKWPLYENSAKNPGVVSAATGHLSQETHSLESMRSFMDALRDGKLNVDDCGIIPLLPRMKEAIQGRFDDDIPVFYVHYRPRE
jgi:hypothetical protein